MSARLRWKMSDPERGLRAVIAGPRSHNYTDGRTQYATVSAHSRRHTGIVGWYWTARVGGEVRNTASEQPHATAEAAKAEAAAFVKARLNKKATS
jgi:hypothetical protein